MCDWDGSAIHHVTAMQQVGCEPSKVGARPAGGELQRFAIAVVAAQEADVYMIDEPSSYLDVRQRLKAAQVCARLQTVDLLLRTECRRHAVAAAGDSSLGAVKQTLCKEHGTSFG